MTLRDEVVELLGRLIQVDTVNPPGNETRAAEVLREYLEDSGVGCELYAKVPERANLVARIPGSGAGPRLLLLSHTDTVPADPAEWSAGPWSGEIRDGHVWGRGALDMKGEVAARAVAIASLAREGFRPAGDLIFAACADEEVGEGERYGLPWLVDAHPEAVEAEYAINEGGGERLEIGGKPYYTCSTAEKMASPFRLRVQGRSGHAALPGIADNALVKAAKLIERLAELEPALEIGPEMEALLRTVLGEVPPPERVLQIAYSLSPEAAGLIEPMLSMTVSPTMIKASDTRNVIPGVCEVVLDCRLLPEHTPDEARAALLGALGDADYELEHVGAYGGTRSPLSSPLWDAVSSFLEGLEPEARAVPVCVPGFTDSHWVRERFGTVSYGVFPIRAMEAELASRLVHSVDERVAVDDLELGVAFLRHVAVAIEGAPA